MSYMRIDKVRTDNTGGNFLIGAALNRRSVDAIGRRPCTGRPTESNRVSTANDCRLAREVYAALDSLRAAEVHAADQNHPHREKSRHYSHVSFIGEIHRGL